VRIPLSHGQRGRLKTADVPCRVGFVPVDFQDRVGGEAHREGIGLRLHCRLGCLFVRKKESHPAQEHGASAQAAADRFTATMLVHGALYFIFWTRRGNDTWAFLPLILSVASTSTVNLPLRLSPRANCTGTACALDGTFLLMAPVNGLASVGRPV